MRYLFLEYKFLFIIFLISDSTCLELFGYCINNKCTTKIAHTRQTLTVTNNGPSIKEDILYNVKSFCEILPIDHFCKWKKYQVLDLLANCEKIYAKDFKIIKQSVTCTDVAKACQYLFPNEPRCIGLII